MSEVSCSYSSVRLTLFFEYSRQVIPSDRKVWLYLNSFQVALFGLFQVTLSFIIQKIWVCLYHFLCTLCLYYNYRGLV